MPRIRFTSTPKLPRDLAHLGYIQGTEVDLSEDQASRWLRRGVAEVIPDVAAPVPTAEPAPAPKPVAAPPMQNRARQSNDSVGGATGSQAQP